MADKRKMAEVRTVLRRENMTIQELAIYVKKTHPLKAGHFGLTKKEFKELMGREITDEDVKDLLLLLK